MIIINMLLWSSCLYAGTDGALREALEPIEKFITSDLSRIVMLSGCGLYAWRAWSEGNPMGLVGAGVHLPPLNIQAHYRNVTWLVEYFNNNTYIPCDFDSIV